MTELEISQEPAPSSGKTWKVREGETEVGPVSLDQIRRGLKEGRISPDAEIAPVGSADWIPVSSVVKEAKSLASHAPPPIGGQAARKRRWWPFAAAALVLIAGGAIVGGYWALHRKT